MFLLLVLTLTTGIHNYSHGKSSKSYFRLELERDILSLHHELDAVMFLCKYFHFQY
jgi:hypothetical protein